MESYDYLVSGCYLRGVIGKGAQCYGVYHGVVASTGQSVAMKFLDSNAIRKSRRNYAQSVREIESQRKLTGCPHILPLLYVDANPEFTVVPGAAVTPPPSIALITPTPVVFISTLAPRGDLFDYIACAPFSEELARTYMRQMGLALQEAHKLGIGHRDLKPCNLLLDENYDLLVADWGLCATLRDIDEDLCTTRCGTWEYMAPEVIAHLPYKAHKADVWSAAVILFAMLTRTKPFEQAKPGDWWFDTILCNRRDRFWHAHERDRFRFSHALKHFFDSVFVVDPEKRMTVTEMLEHPWMLGPVLPPEKLRHEMRLRSNFSVGAAAESLAGAAAEDPYYSHATRGGESTEDMPPVAPGMLAPPGGVSEKTVSLSDYTCSLSIPAELELPPASTLQATLPSKVQLQFYLGDHCTPVQLLTTLAGIAETMLCGRTELALPGCIRAHLPRGSTFSLRLLSIDAGNPETPTGARYLVHLDRDTCDAVDFANIVGLYHRLLRDWIVVNTEEATIKADP